jgi:hypothetical protein
MSFSDDLFGQADPDPTLTADLVQRAVRRAERIAAYEGRPSVLRHDGDLVRGRAELAHQIAEALQVRDLPRARELIEDGSALYGHVALSAEVQRQARDGHLASLKAAQEMEPYADPWQGNPEPHGFDEEWLE